VIPTPYIDDLAKNGVVFKQLYTHSLCTPSRASLMTGRYHINTGLTYVLAPGTPAGLPSDIQTLPMVLRSEAKYKTHMVGKWHLGHAKVSQTPVGRGFDTFTGVFMWDVDSYSKQMYEAPWRDPMMIDWVQQWSNGSYHHYAEPAHATEAITREAINVIDAHAQDKSSQDPLFLYVAFTAAHSPLQPLPRHQVPCRRIRHVWRREFCGMVVGLDEGVKNITEHIKKTLGENTLVVVTSDNGGSNWFGGMNVPLRGSKITPFEGGTRVPGLMVDLSSDQKYLGGKNFPNSGKLQEFTGMMHFSDWLPTFLSYAGVPPSRFPERLDGFDMTQSLRKFRNNFSPASSNNRTISVESPRNEVLYEMYYPEEFIFGEGLVAYRVGDFKLIKGIVRDTNYYYESSNSFLNYSNPNLLSKVVENLLQIGDTVFGNNKFDSMRITYTHVIMQTINAQAQRDGHEETLRLYNIREDPTESKNLYHEPWAKGVIAQIESRIAEYEKNRLPAQKAHFIFHLRDSWPKTHVPGDCSMNHVIPARQCRFTHPWIREVRSFVKLSLLPSCY
jgi:arylsulfatase A-like enzyme